MRWTLAAALIVACCSPALALDCPPGAYARFGARGIEYCKRDVYGPAEERTTKKVDTCPAGTRPATDHRGVRTCKAPRNSSR